MTAFLLSNNKWKYLMRLVFAKDFHITTSIGRINIKLEFPIMILRVAFYLPFGTVLGEQ